MERELRASEPLRDSTNDRRLRRRIDECLLNGVYARTDAARPGGVYDAPAGIELGRLFNVLGFEDDEVLEEKKRDLIYPHRINPLTTGPTLPRFVDGARRIRPGRRR